MPMGTSKGKRYVRFSDNPKMDNSGISATETREMYIGDKLEKVTGPVVTGGKIREEALSAGVEHGVVITDDASLQKIAKLVSGGSSLYSAARNVAREYAFMERGSDGEMYY